MTEKTEYKFIVDIDKGLWSDMDLMAELEICQHAAETAERKMRRAERKMNEAEESGAKQDEIDALEDVYMKHYDEYAAGLVGLQKIKDKSSSAIDRICIVTVNGKAVPARKLPFHIVQEANRRIAEAREAATESGN